MTTSAGFQLVAGRIPGERIATTVRTANSAVITAEAVIDTVVASVVAGRTYRITWTGEVQSTAGDDECIVRIREDSLSGTQLAFNLYRFHPSSGFRAPRAQLDVEYTADATEDKTFVLTLDESGTPTGDLTSPAASSQPNYLYVDYIRG